MPSNDVYSLRLLISLSKLVNEYFVQGKITREERKEEIELFSWGPRLPVSMWCHTWEKKPPTRHPPLPQISSFFDESLHSKEASPSHLTKIRYEIMNNTNFAISQLFPDTSCPPSLKKADMWEEKFGSQGICKFHDYDFPVSHDFLS